MNIKQKIIDYSIEIGIDAIGFCKAEIDERRLKIYRERRDKGISCSLETVDAFEQKLDPEYWLKGAKTFIVILERYPIHLDKDNTLPLHGNISQAAINEDYHTILTRKLEKLREFISDNFNHHSKAFCDSDGLSDRELARKAGLGVIGKNSFLINPKFGTTTFIGYLITDLVIDAVDQPLNVNLCNHCINCIQACPGKAILNHYQINANRCVSYLTQAKSVPMEFKKSMGNQLYGCDVCQQVCPYNNDTREHTKKMIDEQQDIQGLLLLNNKTFNETFKKTAAGWRGKKTLQRNGIIALGNEPTLESVQLLNNLYKDERSMIRTEIICSLIRIDSEVANTVLKECYSKEKDVEIIALIEKYLQ